jgi:steroid 5-alpha reductase family enzyme
MIAAAVHLTWIGAASLVALMFVLWLIHFAIRNAAIVDVGWAGGLALLAILYAWLGVAYPPRAILIGAMGGIWGLRLALHLLLTRVIGQPEEGRYVQLRKEWQTNIPLKFLAFYEFQALLCVVMSAPFLLPALNAAQRLSVPEFAGPVVWLIGIAGEAAADAQLKAWKALPESRGKTCRYGLWRYSRHPNYFFEWLIWMGFAVFALGSPYGYISLISPALILYFLLRVTGIPATEAQALRTRGDDYREYQRTTSAFVPWFPRQGEGKPA